MCVGVANIHLVLSRVLFSQTQRLGLLLFHHTVDSSGPLMRNPDFIQIASHG
jgi:hypothetical protein